MSNVLMEDSAEEKASMGQKAREKMEQEFDRQKVVQDYLEEIKKVLQ